MKNFIKLTLLTTALSFVFPNNTQLSEEQENLLIEKMMEMVWQEAMRAKNAYNHVVPSIREEFIENLCSSAPNMYFVTHADLSDTLTQAENTSASVFVSTDGQNSWIENDSVAPIDMPGYENTWGATTTTDGGDNVDWYLSGSIDSGSLGLDFGQITISQSPYNGNNSWPPADNLYALMTEDSSDDTGSGQDIVNIRATYSDNRLYASMGLEGSCCDDGSFFGPWNLYAIAIVNPDAAEPVAYSYAYGNGGFGQLYPAIYKIDGDLATGEVGGFEVLTEDFDYSTAGNNFQARSLLDYIVNDADWGEWPNSLNGVVLVGTTVEAGLDGLDIAIDLLDTSNPAVLVMSTQNQTGNTLPILTNPVYADGIISITYTDFENNLATDNEVLLDNGIGFPMVPNGHTYSEGVIFSANVGTGHSNALISFSDNGGTSVVSLEVELSGDEGCQLLGDANGDAALNVLDVVLTVNLILSGVGNYEACSDINSDLELNVLDIVLLVNLILAP